MKPSIGRIVLVPVRPELNNGADRAPAVITRVWSELASGSWLVNVRVLCDSEKTLWLTSVELFTTEEQALAVGTHVAYWPPRV